MWNDTDCPIGYLITFRAYGTWIHGDERGSIDRYNNVYLAPKYPKIDHWRDISSVRLKYPPVKLSAAQRRSVERAIRETCEKRRWHLYAVNVRTNHAHSVVSSLHGKKPSVALNAFKANATRMMRIDGCWTLDHTPWADKGSERWLWTENHLSNAIEYVVNGQGGDLPNFD